MSLFSNLGQPMALPGYGGNMIPVPDFGLGGLKDTMAQNAAMGQAQPKKKNGFGEFLRMFAGNLGDSLTGNPVFAQQQQHMAEQQKMEDWYERKRRDSLSDYEAQKEIDARYSAPDLPGLADEFNWFREQPPETQARVQDYMKMRYPGQFVPPSPVSLPYGATVTGGDAPQGGAPAGMPRVSSEQDYNALPPGTTYTDPNGVVRKKGGQVGSGSPGGFL